MQAPLRHGGLHTPILLVRILLHAQCHTCQWHRNNIIIVCSNDLLRTNCVRSISCCCTLSIVLLPISTFPVAAMSNKHNWSSPHTSWACSSRIGLEKFGANAGLYSGWWKVSQSPLGPYVKMLWRGLLIIPTCVYTQLIQPSYRIIISYYYIASWYYMYAQCIIILL